MKDRVHFEMGIGEGVDGDFEIGFESTAVSANMEIDGFDRRHRLV